MTALEKLVASPELCEEAGNRGMFPDSALVWVVGFDRSTPGKIGSAVFQRKDSKTLCQDVVKITDIYPAPTLEEIMSELPEWSYVTKSRLGFDADDGKSGRVRDENSAATAALRLLLKLEGGKE